MTLTNAFASFLSRCMALNLVNGTLKWYRNILGDLARFLDPSGMLTPSDVKSADLRNFLSHLRQRGQSSQTISRTYGALRCVFRFWRREGLIATDPMDLIERPRRERHLIRTFTAEQASALISQPDASTFAGLRDRAMILLMIDSGLRVSEVRALETERIDWSNCTLTVMGKGRKERDIPFSPTTGRAMHEYWDQRAQRRVLAREFFVGSTGRPIDRCKIRCLVRDYGRRAEIEGVRLSPHTLRHTFAVFYIRNGGDSFSLQEILGHSTLEMTKQYVNLARRDVAAQHRKYSPVERMLGRALPLLTKCNV